MRSYFYARLRGDVGTFDDFVNRVATPGSPSMERDLRIWLNGTFGIATFEDAVAIDPSDREQLTLDLQLHKGARQAQNDASTILTVYGLRRSGYEKTDLGIFGYRTWWLSKDTTTQRALEKRFGRKYQPSCYMRPDFLQNYIALAPSYDEANQVFDQMFPSLLGVTVSHHVPGEVCGAVHQALRDHAHHSPARVRAMLSTLSDQLRAEGGAKQGPVLKHFLDEQLRELAKRSDLDAK